MRLEDKLHERRPRQLEKGHDRKHLEVVERDCEGRERLDVDLSEAHRDEKAAGEQRQQHCDGDEEEHPRVRDRARHAATARIVVGLRRLTHALVRPRRRALLARVAAVPARALVAIDDLAPVEARTARRGVGRALGHLPKGVVVKSR